jgi:signal transduction histidine kinase
VNHRQTIFLSMLAHELRNPLAPIAAANSVLEGLDIPHPLLPKLTAVLRRQVNHLVHLVDDLLDASRIGSGKISLQKRMVTLHEIIDSAIETTQPSFDARGQKVLVSLAPLPVMLCADLVRLAQLFSNLLINASKFSEANGTIWVSATVQGNTVTVSVKDHGAGIPRELQPHIFDLFTQGAQTLDRASGGLGIGLSLARTLAEMHGGAVTVKSDGAGSGSEFLVARPLPQPVQSPPREPAASTPACEMRS